MDSLLVNESSGEFIVAEKKILSLDNIKNINLFIGANNTRKSRFLRKIAQQKQKVVYSGLTPLNDILYELPTIIKKVGELEAQFPKTVLLHFEANRRPTKQGKRFDRITDFYKAEKSAETRYVQLKKNLELISLQLRELIATGQFIQLSEGIGNFYSLVDLLDYIYDLVLKGVNIKQLSSQGAWTEENANAIQFKIPNVNLQLDIDELVVKTELIKNIKGVLERLLSLTAEVTTPTCIYIPILRSSRNLVNATGVSAGNDIFSSTISKQYFKKDGVPDHLKIITGQANYQLIDHAKHGLTSEREDFKEFERFIAANFYQSKEMEIVPHRAGEIKEIIVSLPNERKDVPIQDLGDGVQGIINLFFPIFTAPVGSWIFIDEPEINLHPGFQNLFIRTLLENSFLKNKHLRYFLNSHSNHILSEILLGGETNSEVYVFQRKDENTSQIKRFEGFEHATLELLGVMNTSTLISNCSIWVEGITDRIYLRSFLTAFLKNCNDFKPIEGLNYSFIEYGGKNLVHYLFDDTSTQELKSGIAAFFINTKIFLLADTDANKEKQHQYYRSLNSNKFQYCQTEVNEIENLLPKIVLGNFLKKKFNFSEAQVSTVLNKSYQNTKLGKFLNQQFKVIGFEKSVSAMTGGTLSPHYKSNLAEFVLQGVQSGEISLEMLAESTRLLEIVTLLYNFIKASNKK